MITLYPFIFIRILTQWWNYNVVLWWNYNGSYGETIMWSAPFDSIEFQLYFGSSPGIHRSIVFFIWAAQDTHSIDVHHVVNILAHFFDTKLTIGSELKTVAEFETSPRERHRRHNRFLSHAHKMATRKQLTYLIALAYSTGAHESAKSLTANLSSALHFVYG